MKWFKDLFARPGSDRKCRPRSIIEEPAKGLGTTDKLMTKTPPSPSYIANRRTMGALMYEQILNEELAKIARGQSYYRYNKNNHRVGKDPPE